MTQSQLVSGSGSNIASATTTYLMVATCGNSQDSTEANAQVTWRQAGTFSGMYVRVVNNNFPSSCTIQFRNNGVNGNQVITVGANATGEFQDTTHTDTIAAADKPSMSVVTVGGGSTFTVDTYAFLFAPTTTTKTVTRLANTSTTGQTISSTSNFFCALAGTQIAATTEVNEVLINQVAGATLTNLYVNVTANTSTTATVVSRVNIAAGALTVSIGSGATGIFEDTTHTDTLNIGDVVCTLFKATSATSITIKSIAVDYTTTNGTFIMMAGNSNSNVSAASTVNGRMSNILNGGTEVNLQVKALIPFSVAYLQCNCSTGASMRGPSTIALRKNSNNSACYLVVGWGQTTATPRVDNTGTDIVQVGDELNMQFIGGAGSGNLAPNCYSILCTNISSVVV